MKYLLIAILALTLTACEQEPERVPARRPRITNNVMVIVTQNGCQPCKKQKDTIDEMKASGDLKGFSVRVVNHSTNPIAREDYPASLYPTTYIFVGGRSSKAIGYHSKSQLLEKISKLQ